MGAEEWCGLSPCPCCALLFLTGHAVSGPSSNTDAVKSIQSVSKYNFLIQSPRPNRSWILQGKLSISHRFPVRDRRMRRTSWLKMIRWRRSRRGRKSFVSTQGFCITNTIARTSWSLRTSRTSMQSILLPVRRLGMIGLTPTNHGTMAALPTVPGYQQRWIAKACSCLPSSVSLHRGPDNNLIDRPIDERLALNTHKIQFAGYLNWIRRW